MISSIRIPEDLKRELLMIAIIGKEKSLSSFICDILEQTVMKNKLQLENKGWKKCKTVSVGLYNSPHFFKMLSHRAKILKLKSRNVLVYQILKNRIKEYKNA